MNGAGRPSASAATPRYGWFDTFECGLGARDHTDVLCALREPAETGGLCKGPELLQYVDQRLRAGARPTPSN